MEEKDEPSDNVTHRHLTYLLFKYNIHNGIKFVEFGKEAEFYRDGGLRHRLLSLLPARG